ncbi:hypothetical protein D6783_01615 [Candidatus Woesearchaeota archaeon]|nr:MAG: hypothetical protein D6783_01615 [Candidatus Woesearchaeota archaeon]
MAKIYLFNPHRQPRSPHAIEGNGEILPFDSTRKSDRSERLHYRLLLHELKSTTPEQEMPYHSRNRIQNFFFGKHASAPPAVPLNPEELLAISIGGGAATYLLSGSIPAALLVGAAPYLANTAKNAWRAFFKKEQQPEKPSEDAEERQLAARNPQPSLLERILFGDEEDTW